MEGLSRLEWNQTCDHSPDILQTYDPKNGKETRFHLKLVIVNCGNVNKSQALRKYSFKIVSNLLEKRSDRQSKNINPQKNWFYSIKLLSKIYISNLDLYIEDLGC